ncbi:MAG: hypothetical protein O2945_20030, partial [Planctomycetota bacterium]|nr:hypothetical protein [Planctomycetota bacterium]
MNADDWIDDNGEFDFEEFQEDASFAADMLGLSQRQRQLAQQRKQSGELRDIKRLLESEKFERRQRQKETETQASKPPCPFCLKPLELRASLCSHCRSHIKWIELPSGIRATEPHKYKETLQFMLVEYKGRCESEGYAWSASLQQLHDSVEGAKRAIHAAYEQCSPKVLALHTSRLQTTAKDAQGDKRGTLGALLMLLSYLLLGPIGFGISVVVTVSLVALALYGEWKAYQRMRSSRRVVESVVAPLEARITPHLLAICAATKVLTELRKNRSDYLALRNLADIEGLPHSPFLFRESSATETPVRVYRNTVESSPCRRGLDRWVDVIGKLESYLRAVS